MRVPEFKEPGLSKFLLEVDRELQKIRKDSIVNTGANKSVLLFSPSLKVYEVTVTDAGVIIATLVQG